MRTERTRRTRAESGGRAVVAEKDYDFGSVRKVENDRPGDPAESPGPESAVKGHGRIRGASELEKEGA